MIRVLKIFTALLLIFFSSCSSGHEKKKYDKETFIKGLISKMTLEEKIGQLSLFSAGIDPTVPVSNPKYADDIKAGRVGAVFAAFTTRDIERLQKMAVEESRLGIPMLFGYDVIHGFKTIFPMPLAETASWNPELIEHSARVAADEASAAGVNWFFAPMVDVMHEPRWGRGVEGSGEDPYLASIVAVSRVKGYQGDDLKKMNTVAACPKHFAGYGFVEAGKEYAPVDVSEARLRNLILPPFKAAVDAGALTIMSAFNDVNGIPAAANKFLMTDILRGEWDYKGFVVSDFGSIDSLVVQGYAANNEQTAELAFNAGGDMDMESSSYKDNIPSLVKEGKISIADIDRAVWNELNVKWELGLFEDPYKYIDKEREKEKMLTKKNLETARQMARESFVLLKNKNSVLPLNLKKIRSIALIGPLADNKADYMGTWIAQGDTLNVVTLRQGLLKQLPKNIKLNYAKGCDIESGDRSGFREAVNAARKSDIILLAIGEKGNMSGESGSRGNITIPGVQSELLNRLAKLNKPVVLLLSNGRPLAIEDEVSASDAVLVTWIPGITGGDAVADVLLGKYNPSGKLPVTFPRSVSQVPIYYNHLPSNRPGNPANRYSCSYIDIPFTPLYPFGYGLSYTTFEYSDLKLDSDKGGKSDNVKVSVRVKNTGDFDGEEVVQLYIRDLAASLIRPVKELKAFKKIFIKKGETKEVTFTLIPEKDFGFYRADMTFGTEPGWFDIFVGTNSDNVLKEKYLLTK